MSATITQLYEREVKLSQTKQEKIADWYTEAKVTLEAIADELRRLPHDHCKYEPIIIIQYYAGINGYPNTPYLKVYVPYQINSFEVKPTYEKGKFELNDEVIHPNLLNIRIVKAYLNLGK